MANDAYTQQALAQDPRFRLRVKAALAKVAWVVLTEPANTADHATRATYARNTIGNLDGAAVQVAQWLVMRTNVVSFVTSYDFTQGAVITAAGDADIESQLSTDWSKLAGA